MVIIASKAPKLCMQIDPSLHSQFRDLQDQTLPTRSYLWFLNRQFRSVIFEFTTDSDRRPDQPTNALRDFHRTHPAIPRYLLRILRPYLKSDLKQPAANVACPYQSESFSSVLCSRKIVRLLPRHEIWRHYLGSRFVSFLETRRERAPSNTRKINRTM